MAPSLENLNLSIDRLHARLRLTNTSVKLKTKVSEKLTDGLFMAQVITGVAGKPDLA